MFVVKVSKLGLLKFESLTRLVDFLETVPEKKLRRFAFWKEES